MNYRNLSDQELVSLAERDPRMATDRLFAELVCRLGVIRNRQPYRRGRGPAPDGGYGRPTTMPSDVQGE